MVVQSSTTTARLMSILSTAPANSRMGGARRVMMIGYTTVGTNDLARAARGYAITLTSPPDADKMTA